MTDEQLRDIHADRDALLQALRDAGADVKGPTRIVCPFHDDRNPSGSVYQGEDGAFRFRCFGCGVCEDIIGVRALAQGRTAGDVLAADRQPTSRPARAAKPAPPPRVFADLAEIRRAVPHVKALHAYTNPTTNVVELVVVRSEPPGEKKRFVQCRPAPNGGFEMKAPAAPLPLYNRGRIATATGPIVVVEGEKCVEALARIGIVATTSPGGADNGGKADWSPLAGKPDVVLWPDQDAPDKDGVRKGHRHMRAVAALLEQLDPPPAVRWLDPTQFDLPPGGDVVDYAAMFGGDNDGLRRQVVNCALEGAEPIGGASDLDAMIEDTIAGRRAVVPLPWPVLDRLSQALVPGTITCVCGDPGSSKSLWVIEAAMHWHRHNVKTAVYMLEENRAYHLNRALAQLASCADITDMRWMAANPDATWAARRQHKAFLDGFARCLYAAPDKHVTLPELAEWVADRARAGCEVIVIDPVTAGDVGDKRHIEDMAFIFRVKSILRQYPRSRVVLTTHPRTGAKGWGDMAGGAAYPRFSQTVFWIHAHQPPRQVLCETWTPVGSRRDAATVGRTIKLGKTRNGRGAGLEIGFEFDCRSLRFFERGVVVKATASEVPDGAANPFAEGAMA